jgi:hypothetical protein
MGHFVPQFYSPGIDTEIVLRTSAKVNSYARQEGLIRRMSHKAKLFNANTRRVTGSVNLHTDQVTAISH